MPEGPDTSYSRDSIIETNKMKDVIISANSASTSYSRDLQQPMTYGWRIQAKSTQLELERNTQTESEAVKLKLKKKKNTTSRIYLDMSDAYSNGYFTFYMSQCFLAIN